MSSLRFACLLRKQLKNYAALQCRTHCRPRCNRGTAQGAVEPVARCTPRTAGELASLAGLLRKPSNYFTDIDKLDIEKQLDINGTSTLIRSPHCFA